MANRRYDLPSVYSSWEPLDLTETEPEAPPPTPERSTSMADRTTQEGIRDIAEAYREAPGRIVASSGDDGAAFDQTCAWTRDPGQDQRDAEQLKQDLRRGDQADPAPHLSDDQIMERLGLE